MALEGNGSQEGASHMPDDPMDVDPSETSNPVQTGAKGSRGSGAAPKLKKIKRKQAGSLVLVPLGKPELSQCMQCLHAAQF